MKINYMTNFLLILSSYYLTLCLNLNKIENSFEAENNAERKRNKHHSAHRRHQKANEDGGAIGAANVTISFNATNNTLTNSLYDTLNTSFVIQDKHAFKKNNRAWYNNKLFDKQLDEIYKDFIYHDMQKLTPGGVKSSIALFTSQFDICDSNKNGALDFAEFKGCFVNDTYLEHVIPPNAVFATFSNYSNENNFYSVLYNIADSYKLNYINLYDYMFIRLAVFSWKHCSVMGPFLEEVGFECAIDIVAGTKTLNRNELRRLYSLALKLSNAQSTRNLDFIAYFMVAQSARLYGKINSKEDGIAKRSEFNLALDSNILPSRYNQEIVDQLFGLTQEFNYESMGIDIISFTFYDFFLRMFEVNSPSRKGYIDASEFMEIIGNYIFPSKILNELKYIPTTAISPQSYQMYNSQNLTTLGLEADHFLKYFQKNMKIKKSSAESGMRITAQGIYTSTYNSTVTTPALFKLLDSNGQGYLSFKDFGTFIQVAYLFSEWDVYTKGKIVAGDLFEKFSQYSDFPIISRHLINNAKKFNLFEQDLYVDIFRTLTVIKVDDYVDVTTRRSDKTLLNEIEIRKIFAHMNLQNVPENVIAPCLRTPIEGELPQYDWECATIKAVTATLKYLEAANNYVEVKNANLTLTNTIFVNIDPTLQ